MELENRSLGAAGEPTLGAACKALIRHWDSGDRNREVGLHLMFLSWYLLLEPPHLTGLDRKDPLTERLQRAFNEVHDYFAPTMAADAEMLYVVGLMAHMTPWLLGQNEVWEDRATRYRVLYRQLAPTGIDPAVFEERAAYGEYFSGQARVKDGY